MDAEGFGSTVFRPARPDMEAAAEAVRGLEDVAAAWEALGSRGHLPASWRDDPDRRFSSPESPGKGPWRAVPYTVDDAVAFASDPKGIAAAEDLARDVAKRLSALKNPSWVLPSWRPLGEAPRVVVWSLRPVDSTLARSDGDLLPLDMPDPLFETLAYELPEESSPEIVRCHMAYGRALRASGYAGQPVPQSLLRMLPADHPYAVDDPELRAVLMSPDPQDADDWKWIGYLPASAFAARAAKRDDGGLASAYVTLSETGYLLEAVTSEAMFLRAPPRAGWQPMASRLPRRRRR